MKIYLNSTDAVIDLHKKGFTNDFQLNGNDLFWIQEKVFIRHKELMIVECHEILESSDSMKQTVVFGIYAQVHNIKGILVNHYRKYTKVTSPVVKRKLNELYILSGIK